VNTAAARNKNGKTLLILLLIIGAMIVLVSLAPTFYRAFCEATGFNGTTQRADNVHPGLPWQFKPEQNEVEVAPGAQTKIFYMAKNLSARTIVGQAVYNVSPGTVGKYFKKIQCFCFSEQTLKPGQKVDMPVIFFVDPAIMKDPDTKDVHEITLSYTFYPVETVTASR
jgi:cytochrome c oxidase assembly protein subunit 11